MKSLRYKNVLLSLGVAIFAMSSSGVFANDDLDVTMRMVTDDETLTDSVVREIRLERPIGIGSAAPDAAGKDIAKDAREQGRSLGQEVSDKAREAARLRREVKETPKPDRPGIDAPAPERPEAGNPGPGKPETGKPQIDRTPNQVNP